MAFHGQPLQGPSQVTLGSTDVLTSPERPLTLLAAMGRIGRPFSGPAAIRLDALDFARKVLT